MHGRPWNNYDCDEYLCNNWRFMQLHLGGTSISANPLLCKPQFCPLATPNSDDKESHLKFLGKKIVEAMALGTNKHKEAIINGVIDKLMIGMPKEITDVLKEYDIIQLVEEKLPN